MTSAYRQHDLLVGLVQAEDLVSRFLQGSGHLAQLAPALFDLRHDRDRLVRESADLREEILFIFDASAASMLRPLMGLESDLRAAAVILVAFIRLSRVRLAAAWFDTLRGAIAASLWPQAMRAWHILVVSPGSIATLDDKDATQRRATTVHGSTLCQRQWGKQGESCTSGHGRVERRSKP